MLQNFLQNPAYQPEQTQGHDENQSRVYLLEEYLPRNIEETFL